MQKQKRFNIALYIFPIKLKRLIYFHWYQIVVNKNKMRFLLKLLLNYWKVCFLESALYTYAEQN